MACQIVDWAIQAAVESAAGHKRFLGEKLHRILGVRDSRSSFTPRGLKKSTPIQV